MDTQFTATPPPRRQSVSGYLDLRCERSDRGPSFLSRKRFKSPIHISKPYWDGQSLLASMMCPTAGMMGGDRATVDVTVAVGASLTLSNPSSLRIHKMEQGDHAEWDQQFTVSRQATLEVNPEWLMLQGESHFRQRTRIALDEDAALLFIEPLAPGRVAHGEAFAFRRFENRLELRHAGELALLEKHSIAPAGQSLSGWRQPFGLELPFYVSILLAAPQLSDDAPLWQRLHDLQTATLRVGASRLRCGPCWSVKILAANPIDARRAIAATRGEFYAAIGREARSLRR